MKAKEYLSPDLVRLAIEKRIESCFTNETTENKTEYRFKAIEFFFNQIINYNPDILNDILVLNLKKFVITEFENENSIVGKIVFETENRNLAELKFDNLKLKAFNEKNNLKYVLNEKNCDL